MQSSDQNFGIANLAPFGVALVVAAFLFPITWEKYELMELNSIGWTAMVADLAYIVLLILATRGVLLGKKGWIIIALSVAAAYWIPFRANLEFISLLPEGRQTWMNIAHSGAIVFSFVLLFTIADNGAINDGFFELKNKGQNMFQGKKKQEYDYTQNGKYSNYQ